MFDISINNPEDGAECILSKTANDTKAEIADAPEGLTAIQKDLEGWGNRPAFEEKEPQALLFHQLIMVAALGALFLQPLLVFHEACLAQAPGDPAGHAHSSRSQQWGDMSSWDDCRARTGP